MKLLDTFCGAGGCSMGYHRAGFDVVGVDLHPQPHYPFEFVQGDAIEYIQAHGHEFDVIHASPPCQHYSGMQHIWDNAKNHPDLIAETRKALQATGKPYVIENVEGAPLQARLMLCGTMFGLPIIRHRFFECSSLPFVLMRPCDHRNVYDPWHGPGRTADKFRAAMGIDWMPDAGGGQRTGTVAQAIPPAYTEWIGKRLLEVLQ